MAKDHPADLNRALGGLPPEQRWRIWMRRIEAVLFASAALVPRADLARVVGNVSIYLLIEDLAPTWKAGRSRLPASPTGGFCVLAPSTRPRSARQQMWAIRILTWVNLTPRC